jgi:hypothetical protein
MLDNLGRGLGLHFYASLKGEEITHLYGFFLGRLIKEQSEKHNL